MSTPAPQAPGTDTAPVIPGAPVVKQTERPHPATPFIRGWLVFVAIVLGAGRQFIPDGEEDQFDAGDLRWILPVLGAMVLAAAVIGFFSWYFTRFVIDDEELRIETGAIFKTSKKIPFERLQSVDIIQPLAARIFGLAELRLEAGAGDSTTKLRYLSRAKASRLRDYLLTRAHGQQASISDLDQQAPSSAFTDRGEQDRTLVTVSPQRLIIGFLLSLEWLIPFVMAIVAVILTFVFDVGFAALGGIIPLIVGGVSVVSRRVISMFNFTLAESPRGLRVTRGLTNLTSQSVPIDRIQGVKISQSFLWRRMDLFRVDVDIVGYGQSSSEDNDSSATSVLLPVATSDQVSLALRRVLPGLEPDQVELHSSPRRARWVRWFDFWTLRYGWDERMLITEKGWLTHTRSIVPHAKSQSVRITQGPLQRKLQLADVHIDTPKGPVNAIAEELDVRVARELALSQLDRMRTARRAAREQIPPSAVEDHPRRLEVLSRFGITRDQSIGGGGETEVFTLDDQRVLRLYRGPHGAEDRTVQHLQHLYGLWSGVDVGIEVPLILEADVDADRSYTIDRRFSGRPYSGWLAQADRDERRRTLITFLDAIERVWRLPSPMSGFARLVGMQAPAQFGSMAELAANMLAGPTAESREQLSRDLPSVAQVWDRLHRDLAERRVEPVLVHGDICPPNAYLSLGPDGPTVTGIGDFSPHTVHGDPMLDVTGAVAFLEHEAYAEAGEDSQWLQAVAVERYGPDTAHWIGVYRRFYGFYFSNAADFDPALYGWCLRQLES